MTEPRSDQQHNIIVTGSSGLLGERLIDRLRQRYQVIGFDRDGQPQPPPEVECVCVDLTDDDSVQLGLQRVRHAYGPRVASVVHLAAYYDFSGEPSPLYDEVNVRGTGRLLSALRRGGMQVGQFVYSSTMLVHAPTRPGRPIDEDSPLEAKWDYPRSKLETERLIRAERGDIPAVLLRIAGVYTDRCNSIPLAQQIHRIRSKSLESHLYPGDPSHGQSFVHLDDVIDAIERTVESRDRLPRDVVPILIGEPDAPGYGDLQRELGRLLHDDPDWSLHEIPKPVAKAGAWLQERLPMEQFVKPWMIDLADDHYELDVGRARDLLGWQPRHRLMDALPGMVAALRKDPEGWYREHGLEE